MGPKSVTIDAGEVRSRGPLGQAALDVGAVLPAVSLAIIAAGVHSDGGVLWALLAWGVAVVLLARVPGFVARHPGAHYGVVTVDSAGVSLDSGLLVARGDVATAERLLAPDGRLAVRIASRLGRAAHLVVVRDESEGRSVVEALGLGRAGRSVTFQIGRIEPASSFQWRLCIASTVLCGLYLVALTLAGRFSLSSRSVAFLVATQLGALGLIRLLNAKHITVGADGVLVRRPFRTPRFVAHARIDALSVDQDSLVLMTDGHEERFRYPGSAVDVTPAARAYRHRAFARSVARLRKVGLEGGASNVALTGDPGALESAAAGHSSYRDSAHAREVVWGVVEDPAAPRAARVRAAVALRVSEADAGRLRAAVEATADPELHAELEAEAARAGGGN